MSSYITVFCKHLLGVHSNASTFALRGELGRYPINIVLYTRLLDFFSTHSEFNVISLAARRASWLSCQRYIFNICCNLDLDLMQIFQSGHLNPKQIFHKIETKLKEDLYEERISDEFLSPIDSVICCIGRT